jgi:signal transduction histidine kinase
MTSHSRKSAVPTYVASALVRAVPDDIEGLLRVTTATLLSVARALATADTLGSAVRRGYTRVVRAQTSVLRAKLAAFAHDGPVAARPALVVPSRRSPALAAEEGFFDIQRGILDALIESIDVPLLVRTIATFPDRSYRSEVVRSFAPVVLLAANLLDFAAANDGDLVALSAPLSAVSLAEEVMRECEGAARSRGVTLVAIVEAAPTRGDRDLLGRALVAIVSRAIGAARGASTVELSVVDCHDGITIELSSSGWLSLPEASSPMCGLELSFCAAVSAAHGGTLELEHRGERTYIHVALPSGAVAAVFAALDAPVSSGRAA